MSRALRAFPIAVAIATLAGVIVVGASDMEDVASARLRRAELKRRLLDVHYRPPVKDEIARGPGGPGPMMRERPVSFYSARYSSANAPPQSPGMPIGNTAAESQGLQSLGYQVARTAGADMVHFTWTTFNPLSGDSPDNDRYVAYNSLTLSSGMLNQGWGGDEISEVGGNSHAGFSNLDVQYNNKAHVTLHSRESGLPYYQPWHVRLPLLGTSYYVDTAFDGYSAGNCPEVMWPRIATSRRPGDSTIHIIAHSNYNTCTEDRLWYWRFDGAVWTGPITLDQTSLVSYVLASDRTSSKLAVAVHTDAEPAFNGLNNVAYYESATDGAGWITGTETPAKQLLTNYTDTEGPQAWLHLSTLYDNSGYLHIAFDEQMVANQSSGAVIRHWSDRHGVISPAAIGIWDAPFMHGAYNLNFSKLSMGIGDGATMCFGGSESNNDYVYITYTQFGGTTTEEQSDVSQLGYYNGELHLTLSTDDGITWYPPANLTNTKTPACFPGIPDTISLMTQYPDSVCRSEHWSSIGMIVHDIDILFVSDVDAGASDLSEGNWQLNQFHYLRLPGGGVDASRVCPCYCRCWADPLCDGLRSNSQDIVETINVAFRGSPATVDAGCQFDRTDVDASGATNSVDVVLIIDVAFRGEAASAKYATLCE